MKLEKIICEICGENNKNILHFHHIIERTEIECSNSPENIAILCPNCHTSLHLGEITIIGVWPATKTNGRILIYIKDGKCNVEGMENEIPPIKIENKSMKVYNKWPQN